MKSLKYCVAGLALLFARTVLSADAPVTPVAPAPAQQAATPVDVEVELAEVVVKGKNLRDEIVKAEDEYYAIFNDVNKDDRYDTHCVFLRLQSDSRMESRVCIPGFVADAMADWAPYRARCQPPMEPGQDEFECLDRNRNGRLSQDEAEARSELGAEFMTLDADRSGSIDRSEFPLDMPPPTAQYQPPPPELVLMEGTKKWYDHMMSVTKADPRLNKMADHLGELYYELASTQRRFSKLDAEVKEKNKKDMSGIGPRAR